MITVPGADGCNFLVGDGALPRSCSSKEFEEKCAKDGDDRDDVTGMKHQTSHYRTATRYKWIGSTFLGPGGAWEDNHRGLGPKALAPGCRCTCKTKESSCQLGGA